MTDPCRFVPDATCPDLWHYLLRQRHRPILLYGMGDGADKVLAVCAQYDIPIADVFASDGFVRGQCFHGRRVLSFSEARETYSAENMIALLCFGTARPEVLETIRRSASLCELYLPDVPVSGGELFTAELVGSCRDKIARAREALADERSREVLDGVIRARLSGRLEDVETTSSAREEVWADILSAADIRTAADLGAYTGDSLRELSRHAPQLTDVLCMEPDQRSFRKLTQYAEGSAERGMRVHPLQAAAWSSDTSLTFHDTGNRNATLLTVPQSRERLREVCARSLDSAWGDIQDTLPQRRLDYIKYDVEGAEREALLGSREVMRAYQPRLLVSVYHKSTDLWELPLLVRELYPEAALYLRRMAGVPTWDIELYAVPQGGT